MSLNFSLLCLGGPETNYQKLSFREAPFFKCVVSIWALGGMVCSIFFPTLSGGVMACQDGLGHFFSTFARLTEGGGSKAIWAMPI